MEGEIKGRKAKGIIAFDQIYMAADAKLYREKDLVMENKVIFFGVHGEPNIKMEA